MIQSITDRLYADIPRERLYHYTTFSGLQGIVGSRRLWTSDVRYMNDSAELRHTADLIGTEVNRRIRAGHPRAKLLSQFIDWVSHRIINGHMVFAASFRANGNLLSQWRAYGTPGKGVSLGFNPGHILRCARRQQFQVGRCIYEPAVQRQLVNQVIDAVEDLADHEPTEAHSDHLFATLESDLLRLAALLKHPSFREEDEWRVVSPVMTEGATTREPDSPVRFREGKSMLVPYIEFNLTEAANQPLPIDHVFLGPTAHSELSLNSLRLFLAQQGITPRAGVDYCQIPYRHH